MEDNVKCLSIIEGQCEAFSNKDDYPVPHMGWNNVNFNKSSPLTEDLKKNATKDVSKIAAEISAEVIKQIIDTEVNKSNVSAIVEDIIKRKVEKHI